MADQSIHKAAAAGNLPRVQQFLRDGTNVDAKDEYASTPLFWASQLGNLELVKFLVQARADVEAKNVGGYTPLFWASGSGKMDVVKYLVEQAGANAEAKNNAGQTALVYARSHKQAAIVQYLEQGPRQQDQHARFPNFPSLPDDPPFSHNRSELVSTLEQWVRNVESILSGYLAKVGQWKDQEIQSCQAQVEVIDKEIAKLEAKKAGIQQKNNDTILQAIEKAEVSVRQCEQKISDTCEIIGSLGGGEHPRASAPSADQDSNDCGPPISLCCPITLQLMADPVMIIEDGQTYERSAILEHWRTQEAEGLPVTSPQTNQRLLSKQLAPNVLVRSQCHECVAGTASKLEALKHRSTMFRAISTAI